MGYRTGQGDVWDEHRAAGPAATAAPGVWREVGAAA